jgi:hypothetical protein
VIGQGWITLAERSPMVKTAQRATLTAQIINGVLWDGAGHPARWVEFEDPARWVEFDGPACIALEGVFSVEELRAIVALFDAEQAEGAS